MKRSGRVVIGAIATAALPACFGVRAAADGSAGTINVKEKSVADENYPDIEPNDAEGGSVSGASATFTLTVEPIPRAPIVFGAGGGPRWNYDMPALGINDVSGSTAHWDILVYGNLEGYQPYMRYAEGGASLKGSRKINEETVHIPIETTFNELEIGVRTNGFLKERADPWWGGGGIGVSLFGTLETWVPQSVDKANGVSSAVMPTNARSTYFGLRVFVYDDFLGFAGEMVRLAFWRPYEARKAKKK